MHSSGVRRFRWQSPLTRAVFTVMTVAVMVMIYCFSTEDADHSNETSGTISQVIIPVVAPDYERLPPENQHRVFSSVQTVVRKCAHFSEYALLGLMLRFCLECWFGQRQRKHALWAWAHGTLYAMTDELHQMLVDGRSGQFLDVGIDSAGVLTGVALASGILFLARRGRHGQPETLDS